MRLDWPQSSTSECLLGRRGHNHSRPTHKYSQRAGERQGKSVFLVSTRTLKFNLCNSWENARLAGTPVWEGSDGRIPRFSGISGLNVELQANERLCVAKVPSLGKQYLPNLHGSNTTAHRERETKQFIRLTYRAMGEGVPGRRMGDFSRPRSAASRDGGFLMAARTGAPLHLYHLSPPRDPEVTCNYGRLASDRWDRVVSYSGSCDLPIRTKGQRSTSPAEVIVGEQAQLDF